MAATYYSQQAPLIARTLEHIVDSVYLSAITSGAYTDVKIPHGTELKFTDQVLDSLNLDQRPRYVSATSAMDPSKWLIHEQPWRTYRSEGMGFVRLGLRLEP